MFAMTASHLSSVALLALVLACSPKGEHAHGAPRHFDLPPVPKTVRAHDVQYTCNGKSYTALRGLRVDLNTRAVRLRGRDVAI